MGKVIRRGETARRQACEIVKNGGTLEEAALATGYGKDYVRQLCKQNGIWYEKKKPGKKACVIRVKSTTKRTRKKRLDHEAMRQYFAEGHTAQEVAQKFGASKDYARHVCAGIRSGNQYTNGLFDREANAIKCINERAPGFEYAGNFTGVDGYVDLRCKTCGTVIRKSFVSVRHSHAVCDECIRREREQRQAERQAEREREQREREERQHIRWISASFEQRAMSVCPCCGGLFIATGNMKYCSAECSKRVNNALQKDKRVRKIKHALVDRNITLERLYERDHGKCYICGQVCDWDDYAMRDDHKITGDNYPSIDHIVPLSKGGKHAWGNVKLACRRCNYLKSDTLSPACSLIG